MDYMITKREALDALFRIWNPQHEVELVPLEDAWQRVLAQTQYARCDLPVVRSARMDGIGVASADFVNGLPDTSDWTLGKEYVRADTGDDFDDRFDSVIPIEMVSFSETGEVSLDASLSFIPGMNVAPSGSLVRKEAVLAKAGLPLRAVDLGALAMGGIDTVPVYAKPRVAFIPTGSELVPVGTVPERGQNIDSNSIMARFMLKEMGAEPVCFPIVKDSPSMLEQNLNKALEQADVVIINGGSSKGSEDFNASLLKQSGTTVCHWTAAGPGRPICIAVISGKPVINLPGPTIGAFYGMDWCVRAIVEHFLEAPPLQRQRVQGVLMEDMKCPAPLEFLCRVQVVRGADGDYEIWPRPFKTSSLPGVLSSNGLFVSPIGDKGYCRGEKIEVELLRGEEWITREERKEV